MATPLKPMKKDSNLLAAIAYVLGIVVALLIYLIEKEDKWVRFHAMQAIVFHLAWSVGFGAVFIVLWVVALVTMGVGALCIFAIFPIALLVMVANFWFAYRAYKGEYFELPVIGEFTASHI